jgi:cell division septum initiation protein DivIVA
MTLTTLNGGQSRLTPDQVRAVSFEQARLGRRGLDERKVWEFCEQVEYELIRLLNEKVSLHEEVKRLRNRIINSGTAPGDGLATPEDAHIQAVSVLARAQRAADQYVAEAQTYSRQITEDARQRHDQIIAETRARAELILEEARADASRAAAAVPLTTEPMEPAQRQELQAELAYLKTFSHVYRSHLRAYLEALLSNIDQWEQQEKQPATPTWPESLSATSPEQPA